MCPDLMRRMGDDYRTMSCVTLQFWDDARCYLTLGKGHGTWATLWKR